jgi:hypothetical protein
LSTDPYTAQADPGCLFENPIRLIGSHPDHGQQQEEKNYYKWCMAYRLSTFFQLFHHIPSRFTKRPENRTAVS